MKSATHFERVSPVEGAQVKQVMHPYVNGWMTVTDDSHVCFTARYQLLADVPVHVCKQL